MVKRRPHKMSDEIRAAILNCGRTRYKISLETGIDPAALCRFVHGQTGMTTDTLDKLAECLGLHVSIQKPKGKA